MYDEKASVSSSEEDEYTHNSKCDESVFLDTLTIDGGGEDPTSIPMILKNVWEEDLSVVKDALQEIANLCDAGNEKEAQNREEITNLGGPMTIVTIMNRYETEPSIQAEGCAVLQNLAISDEARAVIARFQGVQPVVAAMKKFPLHEDIQEWGTGALRNLCWNSKENQRLVVKNNGIPVILNAMQRHPALHYHVASTLFNFITFGDDDVKDAIFEADCLSAIARAAQENSESDENMKKTSVKALKVLLKVLAE